MIAALVLGKTIAPPTKLERQVDFSKEKLDIEMLVKYSAKESSQITWHYLYTTNFLNEMGSYEHDTWYFTEAL